MRAIHFGLALAVMYFASVSCDLVKKSPTPPSPTVTSITFTASTDVLKVGEAVTFAATASHTDGSSAQVTEWRSDAPTVATVDAATGKVTGVGAGTTTIVAAHDGTSGTMSIKVVPDFGGTWQGEFRINNCSGSGPAMTVCTIAAKTVGQIEFRLTQNLDQVTGTLDYKYYLEDRWHPIGPVSVGGAIGSTGHLTLTGEYTNVNRFVFVLRADGSDFYLVADRMAGAFIVDMTIPPTGHMTEVSYVTFGHTIWGSGLTKVQ